MTETLLNFISSNLLIIILLFPLLNIPIIFIINHNFAKIYALSVSLLNFILSLFLWLGFDKSCTEFQFFQKYQLYFAKNINFIIGIDGISLFFIILTTFLIPICLLASWQSITKNIQLYLSCFLLLEAILIGVFSVLDLIVFYICFESVLLPMFLIIGIWGSRQRKIHAAYQFFLYTLFGSLLMLFAIIIIYFDTGTTDYFLLLTANFSETKQLWLWLAFFMSFATKVPMIPLHIWLPEAHVEAPTAGSVILAGILLKLGTYGLLRFSIPLFPFATIYFTPLIYMLSVLGIIYGSLTTLRQIDLKKIIAYSSVAHMGFVTLGMFTLNMQGLEGSLILMLSHGLVSGALFLSVGILYDRYHTRLLKYYSGLVNKMPLFSILFVFFTLANISLPGTSSFVGELLILVGAFQSNTVITVLASFGIVLGAAYAIWLCNRINFGQLKYDYINIYTDITRREFVFLLPFVFLICLMGIYPEIFLDTIHVSIMNLLQLSFI